MTVTFDKSHSDIGLPGPWTVPPVQVQPPLLQIRSTSMTAASQLIVTLTAVTPGTTNVTAGFDQECTAGDTTPPQATLSVPVTVIPRS